MDRSVAQGREADPGTNRAPDGWLPARSERLPAVAVGCLLALVALVVYGLTHTDRYYDHFVWQAAAFLEGHAAIRYPVEASAGLPGNAWFQDVMPLVTADGVARGVLPFPPLPAVFLLPFVAIWGLTADDQWIFTALAAVDVAVCWWLIGRLPVGRFVRLGTTVFFAFGTVFWYTAQNTTTWYQAHVLAVGLTMLAIGVALDGDPAVLGRAASGGRRRLGVLAVDRRQFVAGLLFGLAGTARLPIVIGAPFFVLVGSGGDWRRRAWSAGLGAALPVLALVGFNVVATGSVVNPAYEYLYRLEAAGYPTLGYNEAWAIEDVRYVPQNFGIALLGTPDVFPTTLPDSLAIVPVPVCLDPDARRGLFDVACPLAVPRDTGMSVLLTSPGYLLALPLLGLRRLRRSRVVWGAGIAVVAIGALDLMHFSQGWVQFGYRFSNDAAPFALLLVALGLERLVGRRGEGSWRDPGTRRWGMLVAMILLVLSVAINLWGVVWGVMLGW